jgi:hypothetical protein
MIINYHNENSIKRNNKAKFFDNTDVYFNELKYLWMQGLMGKRKTLKWLIPRN